MINKLYNFFYKTLETFFNEKNVIWLIGAFLGLLTMLFLLFDGTPHFDISPATDNDYAPLITQKDEIKDDFYKLFTYDNYEICTTGKNTIVVTLYNEECKVKCTFSKNLKLTSYDKIDCRQSIFEVMLKVFLFYIVISFLFAALIVLLASFITFILILIKVLLKLVSKLVK